jgi:NAD-dependent oxidoreductase involved in siderophore biosynthesis
MSFIELSKRAPHRRRPVATEMGTALLCGKSAKLDEIAGCLGGSGLVSAAAPAANFFSSLRADAAALIF